MKASIAHGIRPSVFILGKDSRKPWGKWDLTLAKAYQRFLNELCQQCGNPRYICHTDDNRVQFKLSEDLCASAAVSERAQDAASKKETKSYGKNVYAQPYLTEDAVAEGVELSDLRRPYLIDRAKKMGLIPES
jgi:hypothetical protein